MQGDLDVTDYEFLRVLKDPQKLYVSKVHTDPPDLDSSRYYQNHFSAAVSSGVHITMQFDREKPVYIAVPLNDIVAKNAEELAYGINNGLHIFMTINKHPERIHELPKRLVPIPTALHKQILIRKFLR